MKKNYLFLSVLLSSFVGFAQSNLTQAQVVGKTQTVASTSHSQPLNISKTSLWQNNFSTPSQWSFQSNGIVANWVIGTTAPSGPFAIPAILSTTAANNFAKFDSDLLCGAEDSQNSDVYFNTPINLTGNPAVQVTCQSYYRQFHGSCFIIASTDGVTWQEFPVNVGITTNNSSANPALIFANVSSVIGNSPTAYIGFRYKGGCDYAWMVDDVQIETLPDNDIAVNTVWTGDIETAFEYSKIPLAQVTPLSILTALSNNGAVTQTNVPVKLEVTLAGAPVHTETQNVTFPVGVIDTILFTTTYVPPTVGAYKIKVSVPADDISTNGADSVTLSITDFIYGHDFNTATTFGFDEPTEYSVGNIYGIENDADLTGAQVQFATGTDVGVEVAINVYLVGTNIQDMTYIDGVNYVVQSGNIGTAITVPFVSAIPLTAGELYVIEVRKFDTDLFYLAASNEGDDDFSSVSFGPWGTGGAINFFNGWGSAPAIRMNFDPSLSINENAKLAGVKVYPNPSTGIVNISNDLNIENTITVLDLTGKVVASKIASTATSLDLSNVGTGIYLVEVSNANGKKVERVVIK